MASLLISPSGPYCFSKSLTFCKASFLAIPRSCYASVIFPFTEFPNGILVTLYDKSAKKTFVKADFATSFKLTDIIDLRGNVKITSDQGAFLETQQLYYDQKNEWFYTEKFFKLTDPKNGNTSGEGVDFNKDFTVVNYQKVRGTIDQVK